MDYGSLPKIYGLVEVGLNGISIHGRLEADRSFVACVTYLSYDGCLEVRGEIIRTVLCCIVY